MKYVRISAADNVGVALCDIKSGEVCDGVKLLNDIPRGHKFSLCNIKSGQNVIKYASPIGHAACDIAAGEHVHTHNVKSNLAGLLEYEYNPVEAKSEKLAAKTFMGYRRKDGRVGIRNEIWIIPTVGCVNSIGEIIAKKSEPRGSVDGVYAFTHPYGCSQLGGDHEMTKRALAGLVNHPNAAGVLVLALGCENNTVEQMKEAIGGYDEKRVRFLVAQDVEDEVAEGVRIVGELIDAAKELRREEIPASELVIGLKCGGSDGLSGITANPLVGEFSDMLCGMGGTTILTEVPEMFGAETILMNRCRNRGLFEKTVKMINDFKGYYMRYGEKIDENPSPGNKAGGITTLEDKALGCTQKGGLGEVCGVLDYGEPVLVKGLNLLTAPGNDLVASTALAVSGAHIVLFTTGRGTPFGCPVPTVKISTNTALYDKKRAWIDFDAGVLVTNGFDMKATAEEFFSYILAVAGGEKTATEKQDIRDIAIFKDGVTL
ncbi:MAG: altronate dehydratase [Oscillospiraceae bacterium]|nr:altronate dehydratase [Oscillospiraceae bacterium]